MKKGKWIAGISIVSISILIVCFLIFRRQLLEKGIEKALAKIESQFNVKITISAAKWKGLTGVEFENIIVIPTERKKLAQIQRFYLNVKILPLFAGTIKLNAVEIKNGSIDLYSENGLSNLDFLLKPKKDESKKSDSSELNIGKTAKNLINELLYKIPDNMSVENVLLNVNDEGKKFTINGNSILLKDKKLNATFILNDTKATWKMDGMIDPSDQKLNIRFYGLNKPIELPYIEQKYGLVVRFDTVSTRMDELKYEDDEFRIYGNWAVRNLVLNNERISTSDVTIQNASIDANMFFGKNFISIDSSSVVFLENLKAKPFIKYTLGKNKEYQLKINTGFVSAQDFFSSFPDGLFENLEGIKTSGEVNYSLNFKLEESNPDALVFSSSLARKEFKITGYGKTDLRLMNGSFAYTPYEKGKPVRNVYIGPANPYYCPFEQIPSSLKNAILSAEDGYFFSHNGFNEDAFRKSIIINFKEKSFKRGGSTISMQLVKNVFLNRQKTVMRKIEEALIVWLIENNRLTSKARMFEVYLNAIEWGPNVYGIGEAASFYFNKHPSALTLGESIFLTSIVPRPKFFRYSFTGEGTLKPYIKGYFRLISGIMLRRGAINSEDTIGIFNSVSLQGRARDLVVLSDTIPDTELEDEDLEYIQDRPELFENKETTQDKSKPENDNFVERIISRREQRKLDRKKEKELKESKSNLGK